jgi:hypothetical protein
LLFAKWQGMFAALFFSCLLHRMQLVKGCDMVLRLPDYSQTNCELLFRTYVNLDFGGFDSFIHTIIIQSSELQRFGLCLCGFQLL